MTQTNTVLASLFALAALVFSTLAGDILPQPIDHESWSKKAAGRKHLIKCYRLNQKSCDIVSGFLWHDDLQEEAMPVVEHACKNQLSQYACSSLYDFYIEQGETKKASNFLYQSCLYRDLEMCEKLAYSKVSPKLQYHVSSHLARVCYKQPDLCGYLYLFQIKNTRSSPKLLMDSCLKGNQISCRLSAQSQIEDFRIKRDLLVAACSKKVFEACDKLEMLVLGRPATEDDFVEL